MDMNKLIKELIREEIKEHLAFEGTHCSGNVIDIEVTWDFEEFASFQIQLENMHT
jgi:hypothetical protein